MNQNERIAQLEETIRLKDQEIYDVQVWKFLQCFWVSLLHIH